MIIVDIKDISKVHHDIHLYIYCDIVNNETDIFECDACTTCCQDIQRRMI